MSQTLLVLGMTKLSKMGPALKELSLHKIHITMITAGVKATTDNHSILWVLTAGSGNAPRRGHVRSECNHRSIWVNLGEGQIFKMQQHGQKQFHKGT